MGVEAAEIGGEAQTKEKETSQHLPSLKELFPLDLNSTARRKLISQPDA